MEWSIDVVEFVFYVVLTAAGLIGLFFIAFALSAGIAGMKEYDKEIKERRRRTGGKIVDILLIAAAMIVVYRDYRHRRQRASIETPRQNRAAARTPR